MTDNFKNREAQLEQKKAELHITCIKGKIDTLREVKKVIVTRFKESTFEDNTSKMRAEVKTEEDILGIDKKIDAHEKHVHKIEEKIAELKKLHTGWVKGEDVISTNVLCAVSS